MNLRIKLYSKNQILLQIITKISRAISASVNDEFAKVTYRHEGNKVEESARIVVGADGINSIVRKGGGNIEQGPRRIIDP